MAMADYLLLDICAILFDSVPVADMLFFKLSATRKLMLSAAQLVILLAADGRREGLALLFNHIVH